MSRRPVQNRPVAACLAALALFGAAIVGIETVDGAAHAAPPPTFLLSTRDTGLDRWRKANPEADGRGVVIAVLDTGVDPATVGLATDPDGRPRIRAMRDFSGQGRLALKRAAVNAERGLLTTDAGSLRGFPRGFDALAASRKDGVWLAFFDEGRVGTAAAADLDGDGDTHSRFGVVMWRDPASGRRLAAIDTNGDGDLGDEDARTDWTETPVPFAFRSRDPSRTVAPLNIGLHVDPVAWQVELVFDDGGHGTHCAGIAGGRGIAGQEGLDGVAPGVEFLVLKIGDNRLAGGATTDGAMLEAVRYASEWARQHDRPVVINLSYSVGAATEGLSTIESSIDAELAANPLLLAAVAAGNEGPGLSTIGTPASADLVWTAGAALTAEQATHLYGASPGGKQGPRVFGFSSRGGELAKPDGLTPGVAWSTVPPFSGRHVKAGTSMAAPYAAGAMALLVGRAVAAGHGWTPHDIKRALATTARPLADISFAAQGAGIIDLEGAWNALKTRVAKARRPDQRALAGYHVATPIPHRPGTDGSASLWRIGGAPQQDPRVVTFTVTPRFYTSLGDEAAHHWFQVHTLDSDASWARPARTQVVFKGPEATRIDVRVDFGAIAKRPGLHTALVRARTDGSVAFVLPIHVIVPDNIDGDAPLVARGKLTPGAESHIHVALPPPLEGLEAVLSVTGKSGDAAILQAFSVNGGEVGGASVSAKAGDAASATLDADAVESGVWEFVVSARVANSAPANFELALVPRRVEAPRDVALTVAADRLPRAEIALVNRHAVAFSGVASLDVDGWTRMETLTAATGAAIHAVAVGPGVSSVTLTVAVPDASWHALTDLAVSVQGPDGTDATPVSEAMTGGPLTITFNAAPGAYTVTLRPARAAPAGAEPIAIRLTERHVLDAPVTLTAGGDRGLTLYPGVRTPVALASADVLPFVPPGFALTGLLRLVDADGGLWFGRRVQLTTR